MGKTMLAATVVLLVISVYGMKIYPVKEFNTNYMSKDNTTAVKGIFVGLIFMSHFIQYCDLVPVLDNAYWNIRMFLGQLVVVMFFFYSGYGIFESVKRKGTQYLKSFPINRFLKTFLHLDLAVLAFFVLNLVIGKDMTVEKVLLSLLGWKNLGNSNWFMFTILILYFAVYIAFMILKKHRFGALILTTLLTVLYIIIMKNFAGVANYWYNTSLCLPLGLWYSYFKDKIDAAVMKNNITYIITMALSIGLFVLTHAYKRIFTVYLCWTILFTLIVVFFTMKVNFGNKALAWLGNHVFSIYMLQRIPMIIFKDVDAIASNIYIYFALSFAVTAVIAELFDRGTGVLDKLLFAKKSRN